eukprot:scaffold3616_cov124-Isochrysis_galbana.AAC.9
MDEKEKADTTASVRRVRTDPADSSLAQSARRGAGKLKSSPNGLNEDASMLRAELQRRSSESSSTPVPAYWATVVAAAAPAAPQPRKRFGMQTASRATLANVVTVRAARGVLVSRAPRKAPCMQSMASTAGAARARNAR